jgi:predicted type IV restriction endonuclease
MRQINYRPSEKADQDLKIIEEAFSLSQNKAIDKAISIAHKIVEEKQKGNEILINKKPFDFFGI